MKDVQDHIYRIDSLISAIPIGSGNVVQVLERLAGELDGIANAQKALKLSIESSSQEDYSTANIAMESIEAATDALPEFVGKCELEAEDLIKLLAADMRQALDNIRGSAGIQKKVSQTLPMDPLGLAECLIFPGASSHNIHVNAPRSPLIFLPVFQREAVWSPSQVCEFWDSLLRGIPIPSLILAKYDAKSGVASTQPKAGQTTQPQLGDYFLLDGRQRARALLAALEKIRTQPMTGRLAQRLWLDLDWPHKPDANDSSNSLDEHGLKFGLFLCTQSSPWGHNRSRIGRANRDLIKVARANLYDSGKFPDFSAGGSKNGCFDFELPLEHTWPVEARCPIPFLSILDHFRSSDTHTPETWKDFLSNKLNELRDTFTAPEGLPPVFANELKPETLSRVANQLCDCLPKLKRNTLGAIVAELDNNELLHAFRRINRNGSRVNDDELFFAAIKQEEHQCDSLAREASSVFAPLDVVRGAVILATQPTAPVGMQPNVKRDGKDTPPIALSPDYLRSLGKAVQGNGATLSMRLRDMLDKKAPANIRSSLEDLTELLKFAPNLNPDDPGLPAVMLSRLTVTSWLPPLEWLIRWRTATNRMEPGATERLQVIRYVLANHFFADWKPDEAAMLRDALDFARECGDNGSPFPHVCEIRHRLSSYVKPNSLGDPAWLRSAATPSGRIVLPVTPAEWISFQNSWAGSTQHLLDSRSYGGLLPDLSDDLLMWVQRDAMDDWFRSHAKDIALFDRVGQPWDVDHIVPGAYFDGRSFIEPDINWLAMSLSTPWLNLPKVRPDRSTVKNFSNRFGNKRLWPLGFNRKDGDKSADEKLNDNWLTGRPGWEVLSQWPSAPLTPKAALTQNVVVKSSAIDTNKIPLWHSTPSKSLGWDQKSLDSFLEATASSIDGREITIYRELFKVIEPGLRCHPDWSAGESGNRLLKTSDDVANA